MYGSSVWPMACNATMHMTVRATYGPRHGIDQFKCVDAVLRATLTFRWHICDVQVVATLTIPYIKTHRILSVIHRGQRLLHSAAACELVEVRRRGRSPNGDGLRFLQAHV